MQFSLKSSKRSGPRKWIADASILLVAVLGLVSARAWITRPKLVLRPLLVDELLEAPVELVEIPQQNQKFIVIEKGGIVKWFQKEDRTPRGIVLDLHEFVEADPTEEGLLGFAFHPSYPKTPYIYVYYNQKGSLNMRLSRFSIDPQTLKSDPNSETVLIEMEKLRTGHNGGKIEIGPDQMLYLSVGENNQFMDSKTKANLFGKILRIDVSSINSPRGYSIPQDNPFAGETNARGEIWAYGFRNPWRFSFDSKTGEIFLGDVGFNTYEEVNRVKKGMYYGWPIMEGTECYQDFPQCTHEGELPIAAFPRFVLRTVIGGYVYHGKHLPFWKDSMSLAIFFEESIAFPLMNPPPSPSPPFSSMNPCPLIPC